MNFHIITIFPDIFASYFNESILKRAQAKKIIKIKTHDLRKWTKDKHNTVDDRPYGGGAGMLLMAEPIIKAIQSLQKSNLCHPERSPQTESRPACPVGRDINNKTRIILLSAKGKKWTQVMAKKYSKSSNLILICGRYEGIDERVKKFVDEEISIGDYVLTGGEIPAMIITDSITRLLPGVLGNKESAINESHSTLNQLEHPQYTRPEILEIKGKKYKVPKVLLSGNHAKLQEWYNDHNKKQK